MKRERGALSRQTIRKKEKKMLEQNALEILLIEDNPHDVELTSRALKKKNLANNINVLRDGAKAIEYLFGHQAHSRPKLVLLDLELPKSSPLISPSSRIS